MSRTQVLSRLLYTSSSRAHASEGLAVAAPDGTVPVDEVGLVPAVDAQGRAGLGENLDGLHDGFVGLLPGLKPAGEAKDNLAVGVWHDVTEDAIVGLAETPRVLADTEVAQHLAAVDFDVERAGEGGVQEMPGAGRTWKD